PHLLARPAGAVLARGAVGGRLVAGIAAAAVAAPQQGDALTDLGEIGEDMLSLVVQHLRADRDPDHQIVAAGTGLVTAGAALAARRLEMLGVAEVDQGVQPLDRLEDDVTALAAIAAVGAAIFDIFLAPEGDGAGAARARADEDLGLVEKMHGRACRGRERRGEGRRATGLLRCARNDDPIIARSEATKQSSLARRRPKPFRPGLAEHESKHVRELLDLPVAGGADAVAGLRVGPDQDEAARPEPVQRAGGEFGGEPGRDAVIVETD